ncbi:MAG TPA: MFS transporter [Candidatus Acetothermia bacterium]|nr:MFS transporter [Candidatus Acetothermia bacterium]
MNKLISPRALYKRFTTLLDRYDRRLWTLFAVRMIVSIGFGAAMPFVSLYLYRELGLSMEAIGTVMLFSALISSSGRIIGGELADRIGRKPLIAVTMGVRTLFFLLMSYVIYIRTSYLIVALVFLAIRFLGALMQPGISAMVADIVPQERRVEAFGILRIGGNAGWAIGPAIGGFLMVISYWSLFLVTAAASLVGMVLVILFIKESIQTQATERFELSKVLDVGRDRRFLVFCGFSFLLFLVMGQFASTLSVFSTELVGISDVQLGFLYTLNGIIVVLFQWPAALLGGKIGTRRALTLGAILFGVGYFLVGLAPSFYFLLGTMVVITLGEVTFSPSATTAVANSAQEGKMGRYMGFFGLAEALGWSAGPFIGGWLFDYFRNEPLILWGAIAAIAAIAAIGFSIFGQGRKRTA